MARPIRTSVWFGIVAFGCAAISYAGFWAFEITTLELGRQTAIELGIPPAVMLDDFTRSRDIHPGNEVHVTGWIDPRYSTRITVLGPFGAHDSRRMLVMFGDTDPPSAAVTRAVIIVDERYRDALVDQIGNLPNSRLDTTDPAASTITTTSPVSSAASTEESR